MVAAEVLAVGMLTGAVETNCKDVPEGGLCRAVLCLVGLSKIDLIRYCLLAVVEHESSVRSMEKTYFLPMIS
jgi:hypothetical protein